MCGSLWECVQISHRRPNAIRLITPPVGVVLDVVCGVSRVSMEDVIKGVWSLMIAQLVVLFLMVVFPQLVTGLARWFAG